MASVLLCGVVALEGYAAPLRVIRFAPDQDTDRYLAYEWLRRSPPGAVLELPLEGESHNYLYQFATLQHGHRVVNGHSGYTTGLLGHLRGAGSPLSEYERYPDFLRALRALGIRYIVTHAAMFERRGDAVATIEAIRQVSDQIIATTDFGDTSVFWLAAWAGPVMPASPGLREIPASTLDASASHQDGRLQQAFDGNPATRWLTGAPQAGDEWIEIRFDRPRDVGRLRFLQAQRSLGDYPRVLVVEASPDGDEYQLLYRGGIMRQLLQGLVREGYPVPIDVDLPLNRTRTLRIRQTGRTRTWYWSVDELSLWERATP